jgi:hypothetical protein
LRMQEELKRYSDRIRQEGRLPLQARVGANTGEVVVRSIATGGGNVEYTPIETIRTAFHVAHSRRPAATKRFLRGAMPHRRSCKCGEFFSGTCQIFRE